MTKVKIDLIDDNVQPVDYNNEYHVVISCRPFGSVLNEFPITDMTIRDTGRSSKPTIRDYAVRFENSQGQVIRKGVAYGRNRNVGIEKLASVIIHNGIESRGRTRSEAVVEGHQLSLVHEA